MNGPYFPSDFPYDAFEIIYGAIATAAIIGLIFGFIFYIFNALALYQISKNRGYQNAWLAFIPVADMFVLGGIADNINACYNKKTSYRIWMVILNLVSCISFATFIAAMITMLVNVINNLALYNSLRISDIYTPQIVLSYSIIMLTAIACTILMYICQYKIFADYSPNNATLFLILSILFRIAPFILFAIRNKPSVSVSFASQRANQANPYQQAPQYATPEQAQQPTYENNPNINSPSGSNFDDNNLPQ